jgi:hypothetical protein
VSNEKQDPDPDESEKQDLDLYQKDLDLQHWHCQYVGPKTYPPPLSELIFSLSHTTIDYLQ